MKTLQHSFFEVESYRGIAYGGNQAWFPYQFLKKYGCGVVGAADVLLCLQGRTKISEAEYMDFAKNLWKFYLPVIPGSGMTGITLMMGMNRYFRKHHMGYHAFWNILGKNRMSCIEKMLEEGIPVILSVGPNFPCFWRKQSLVLYRKTRNEKYLPAAKTKAHYVVVTDSTENWMQISSWGKKYYINKAEYEDYVKKYSCSLVSNIVCIHKIKRIK